MFRSLTVDELICSSEQGMEIQRGAWKNSVWQFVKVASDYIKCHTGQRWAVLLIKQCYQSPDHKSV